MRYEGVYREVEQNSETTQQKLGYHKQAENRNFFFSLMYFGKINYVLHKVWIKMKDFNKNNSPPYRNLREHFRNSDEEE